jgi:phosphoserine phosphatase
LIDDLTFELLEKHKKDDVLIASGALDFIVEGFANYFGVEEFLGTTTEFIEDKVTGEITGEPNFDKGKLMHVSEWCRKKEINLEEATFYTDSIHDLPLVEKCKNSIVVSPDDRLKEHAENNNLRIINR